MREKRQQQNITKLGTLVHSHHFRTKKCLQIYIKFSLYIFEMLIHNFRKKQLYNKKNANCGCFINTNDTKKHDYSAYSLCLDIM